MGTLHARSVREHGTATYNGDVLHALLAGTGSSLQQGGAKGSQHCGLGCAHCAFDDRVHKHGQARCILRARDAGGVVGEDRTEAAREEELEQPTPQPWAANTQGLRSPLDRRYYGTYFKSCLCPARNKRE
jgi:hypothetical protein